MTDEERAQIIVALWKALDITPTADDLVALIRAVRMEATSEPIPSGAPEWTTNEWGVASRCSEDFSAWEWPIDRKSAVEVAELVAAEIRRTTMAGLTHERGVWEANFGPLEYDLELNAPLFDMVGDWLDARRGRNGRLDEEDAPMAKGLADCLREAIAMIERALP